MNLRLFAAPTALYAVFAFALSPAFAAPDVTLSPVTLAFPGVFPSPNLEVRASDGVLSIRKTLPGENHGLLLHRINPPVKVAESGTLTTKYGEPWTGIVEGKTQTFTVRQTETGASIKAENENFIWSGPDIRFRDEPSEKKITFSGEPGTVEVRDEQQKLTQTLPTQFLRVEAERSSGLRTPDAKLTQPGTVYVTFRDKNGAFVSSQKLTLMDTGEIFYAPCNEAGKKIGYTYSTFGRGPDLSAKGQN